MKTKCLFLSILFLNSVFELSSQSVDGWNFHSQRSALEPEYGIANMGEDLILTISGNGKEYASGSWVKTIDLSDEKFIHFSVVATLSNIEQPNRSVLATIIWRDMEGRQIGPKEFPASVKTDDPQKILITQVYEIPNRTAKAEVALLYRWDSDGEAVFSSVKWNAVDQKPRRMVKLASIHHRPKNSTPSENRHEFLGLAEQAGNLGADIVCLPEAITMVGTGLNYMEVAESIPGATTQILSKAALKHQMYIVAGLLEMEGEVVYNTAVLIDRDGQIAGKYRKVSLPREEIEGGVTPGKSLPIFDTDFGKIGLMVCWDVAFPEPARMLALKGAEVVFMPIWGGNLTLAKARAIENQIYLVTSTYDDDMVSGIIDLEGKIMRRADDQSPVAIMEVDLNQQHLWPWLGEYKNRIKQEMPDRAALRHSN